MAHNVHVLGNYVYVSHYESGIRVLDITTPKCMTEVAFFDTPGNSDWGAFPYTKDSLVFGSSMDGRLFILKIRENPAYTPDDSDRISAKTARTIQTPTRLIQTLTK
jgi:hypothetical protein